MGVTVERLTARWAGPGAPGTDERQARQVWLSTLLAGADLLPPGMPPSAILVVRRLADPLPGQIARSRHAVRPEPQWEQAVRGALGDLWRRAGRPSDAADSADAVVFVDPAELTACLAADVAAGRAAARWWWRQLVPHQAGVFVALARQPELLPAVFAYLAAWGKAEAVLSRLGSDECLRLAHSLGAAYGAPSPETVPWSSPVARQVAGLAPEPAALLGLALSLASPGAKAPLDKPPTMSELIPDKPPTLSATTPDNPPTISVTTPNQPPTMPVTTTDKPLTMQLTTPNKPPTMPATTPNQSPTMSITTPKQPPKVSVTPLERPPLMSVTTPKQPPSMSVTTPNQPPLMSATTPNQPATMSVTSPDKPPAVHNSSPDAPPAVSDLPPWPLPAALPLEGVVTRLGGVLYLINLMIRLGLAEVLRRWALLEGLARALLPDDLTYVDDPIWAALAALDGRDPRTLPGEDREDLPTPWPDEIPADLTETLAADLNPILKAWLARAVPYIYRLLQEALELEDPIPHLLLVPGRLHVTATHVELTMDLERISVPVRRIGLDRDPGWQAPFRRVILFHFV